MRRNVLTWLTAQAPNAHHALILTHNIHFLFVQSVLAAKLRQAGFYTEWKGKYGDQAWALLEKSVGTLA